MKARVSALGRKRAVSIRASLSLFLVLLVASLSLIAISAQTASYRYIDEFRDDLQSHYNINAFLAALKTDLQELGDALRSSERPDLDRARARHLSLETDLSRIARESDTSLAAWFEINALTNALAVYGQKGIEALAAYAEGDGEYYQAFYAAQRIENYMETYASNLQTIRLSQGGIYYASLAKQARDMRVLVTAALVAAALLVLRFTFSFSRRFTEPIRALAELSRRMANGELDVPALTPPRHERDEIGTLTSSFNAMSRNIRELVADLENKSLLEKKLHEEEMENETTLRALREAELINLQTQIKPHFFFNAVNTIARQAELERAESTAALVRSLGTLFRYSLVGHQQTVPLEQELMAVREYAELQKRRFGDRMSFCITVSDPVPAVRVPPLIVLPFAENAVYHGLEPLVSGGRLRIDARARGGMVVVRVADNGTGMDTALAETGPGAAGDGMPMGGEIGGIGIRNVIRRMGLWYGSRATVRIYSRTGRGTLVVLTLPMEG